MIIINKMPTDINKEIKRVVSQFQKRYGNNLTINNNGIMTNQDECQYNQKYNCNEAFKLSVNDIQSAIHVIPFLYAPHNRKTCNSYSMKHTIEKNDHYIKLKGHGYLSNGDLIVAMLIMGYKYRYNKGNQTISNPNVDFYVVTSNQIPKKKELVSHERHNRHSIQK